ncbi:helix-turn-helix domain-containing protein [Sphingobium naphthae]|uniref:LysR family transcriptional regulator n=1 Tax=Sphingobium naphthae TaxID=1886786 RepID=A0ABU4A078_9SPHN|nr:LysR family transcriptional regulator [Sphingobium naphthae]MDV5825145.1 LysR family transcriptional regulator [Sphingobium naphthae]
MDQTQTHRSPPAPAPVRGHRAHWTPARQCRFLAALMETGSVGRAARAVGMSRSSAHRLRQRLAGTPFDRNWEEALALHARLAADPLAWHEARAAAGAPPAARR